MRRSAQSLGVTERSTVVAAAAERSTARLAGSFDVVFADPPYSQPFPAALFATLRERGAFAVGALVVYEHSARNAAPSDAGFRVVRTAHYGAVAFTFLEPVV